MSRFSPLLPCKNERFQVLILDDSVNNAHAQHDKPAGAFIPKLLKAYFENADYLYKSGVRKFLFIVLPPLDRSPKFSGEDKKKLKAYYAEFAKQLKPGIEHWASKNKKVGSCIRTHL